MKRSILIIFALALALLLAVVVHAEQGSDDSTGSSDDSTNNSADNISDDSADDSVDDSGSDSISDLTDDASDDSSDDVLEVSSADLTAATAAPTVDACMRQLKLKYPRASGSRIEEACKRFMGGRVIALTSNKGPGSIRSVVAKKLELRDDRIKLTQADRLRLRKAEQLLQEKFGDQLTNLTPEDQKKLILLGRGRMMHLLNSTLNLSNYTLRLIEDKDNFYKLRLIDENNKLQLQQKHDAAEQHYEDAKATYGEDITNFKRLLEAEKRCSGDTCNQLKNQSFQAAKDSLLKLADMMLETLNKVRARVEASETLSAEASAESLSNIDELISIIKTKKEKIAAVTTKDELKLQGKELLALWKGMKLRVRLHEGRLVYGELVGINIRATHLENRLDRIIEYMKNNNLDTTVIESKVEEFSKHIAQAQDYREQAKAVLKDAWDERKGITTAATEDSTLSDAVKQAHDLLAKAREEINQAHTLLVDILKLVREQGVDITRAIGSGNDDVVAVENVDDRFCTSDDCAKEVVVSS